jgi:hypothetical protein
MAAPQGPDSRLQQLLQQLPEPVRWLVGQQLENLAQLEVAVTPVTKQMSTSASTDKLQSRVQETIPPTQPQAYKLRPLYKCAQPKCNRSFRTNSGWANHQRKVHSLSVSSSDAPESPDTDLRTLVRARGKWEDYEVDSSTIATTASLPVVSNKSPRAGPSLQHIGNQRPMLDDLTLVHCQHCHHQLSVQALDHHYSRCRVSSRRRSKRSQAAAATSTASLISHPLVQTHCRLPEPLLQQPLAIWSHMPKSPTASRIPSGLGLFAPTAVSSDDDATDSGEDAASIDSGVGLEPSSKRAKPAALRPTARGHLAPPRSVPVVAAPPPPLLAQVTPAPSVGLSRGYVPIYRSPTGVQAHMVSGYATTRTYSSPYAAPYTASRLSSSLSYGYNASVARSHGTAYAQAKMANYSYTRAVVASASSHDTPPPLLHFQHLGFHLNMTYGFRL